VFAFIAILFDTISIKIQKNLITRHILITC